MLETLPFQTRARTVDHLGREQIADCPTAISELWKNAYDAYARKVSLHIFDDPEPVAAIFDDGHGMSYREFVEQWLVVGTGSKYEKEVESEERNGLARRTKQGQKGIGRLSSANLGPLLLITSKRKDDDFVAALIDWRIFENPFLTLSDIEVPITQYRAKDELLQLLAPMFDRLIENIRGNSQDRRRNDRLKLAWETYDRVTAEDDREEGNLSDAISETIIKARFEEKHFEPWPVWSGEGNHGTALVVSDINYDLRAQLPSIEPDANVEPIREYFVSTLSAFTDPYSNANANERNAFKPEFSSAVIRWKDGVPTPVIEDETQVINRKTTEEMEHVLSGNVDKDGIFRGRVKAFGEWCEVGADYEILPPKDLKVPKGPTTFVGPFSLHVSTFEMIRSNSSLSDEDHKRFSDLVKPFSGFLVFRNGLRVLPYGRTDNDFFEIETRRSLNAGREFWNARRMFGRIAISRQENPNLRDKAGREGFIDNRSAKVLRALVINILRKTAYDRFGSNSDLRDELLPDIRANNAKEKADIARKQLRKKTRSKFRSQLKKNLPLLSDIYSSTSSILSEIKVNDGQELKYAQKKINELSERLRDVRVTGAPRNLGDSEEEYRSFRFMFSEMRERIRSLEELRDSAINEINPLKPDEIAEHQFISYSNQLRARLRGWKKSIDSIQESERNRVITLLDDRMKSFQALATPLVAQVRMELLGLDESLKQMKALYYRLDEENEDTFQSYVDALEMMSESINIELIARQGTEDNMALKDDLNRLNQLAQLGITVEILDHELSANGRMIREGLRQVRANGNGPGIHLIEEGFDALSQQLEFLSPLKISGMRTRRIISGPEIIDYLDKFFNLVARSRRIKIHASDQFRAFSINEMPSRLLPVFVNLVNNSVYWLVNSRTHGPEVYLSVVENNIVVADNGPGIDPLDQESLFKMFFTRKSVGGRGIGLYLCRINLMAGGHSIQYAVDKRFRLLSGANFQIKFKGATYD